MEAAQPGLGNYAEPPDGGYFSHDSSYRFGIVRDRALRAVGIYELGEEARATTPPQTAHDAAPHRPKDNGGPRSGCAPTDRKKPATNRVADTTSLPRRGREPDHLRPSGSPGTHAASTQRAHCQRESPCPT